ncbi:hypothetical protein ED208_05150 [Stagnimonas aquatica]|uniref:DUF2867 domain-containing protein n=1 Tax=Stagnimonas aquatica TaxID=2689987 RepID=A0A3N0VHI5_9GAMM|nr:hypothetical protein ED208_05150 [Stagnimonas aquatica]
MLCRYASDGGYADCYAVEVDGAVSLPQYLRAFYTGRLFRLERLILRLAVNRPSSDAQLLQLAAGATNSFAAWTVEARDHRQLLLSDYLGRTRSWLMVLPLAGAPVPHTRLYFGSAVVPLRTAADGVPRMGWLFHALLGFHRLYSRLLLRGALARLHRPALI